MSNSAGTFIVTSSFGVSLTSHPNCFRKFTLSSFVFTFSKLIFSFAAAIASVVCAVTSEEKTIIEIRTVTAARTAAKNLILLAFSVQINISKPLPFRGDIFIFVFFSFYTVNGEYYDSYC